MASSLQEQLLKAGLADQKKLREVAQEKRKKTKQPKGPKAQPPVDAAKQRMEQALAEKQARDRALNQQKQEAAKAREQASRIRQMVEQHRLPPEDGDIAYHFTHDGKVKTLYVSAKTQHQLARGRLAITAHADAYALVPAAVADKIRQHDPAWLVVCNQASEEPAADDPYAQYVVPDDLMW